MYCMPNKKTKNIELPEEVENAPIDSSKDLKELIEQNIKWTQVVYEQNKKIRRRLGHMIIFGYIRLFILLAPIIIAIILAIIYLPVIQALLVDYQQFFGGDLGLESIGNLFGKLQSSGAVEVQISPEQLEQLRNMQPR